MKVKIKKMDKSGTLVDEGVNTISSFTCKAILGLGITSVIDFVRLCDKYKVLREAGVSWYSATTFKFNKKANIHVFDSVKELFRFVHHLKPNHVVVISEVPTILKEVKGIIPLDYDQQRSFEFNFKQIDPNFIAKVLKSKTLSVESSLVSNDNLGYHIDRIRNTSDMIAAFITLTSNLPFDQRTIIRKALFRFFNGKKIDTKIVTTVISDIAKTFKVKDEAKKFIEVFSNEGFKYHQAVNTQGTSLSTIANQCGVDTYTLSYMKKLIRNMTIVKTRNAEPNGPVLR